jgi:hypothetical protein
MAAADSKAAAEPESVRPADVVRDHSATAALNDLRELDRRARMDMILYRGRFGGDPESLPAFALTATIPTRR